MRFDFSHFSKMTDEEIAKVEEIVNEKISENIALDEKRMIPIKQAVEEYGATALFGEKYGDLVRVITFDPKYSVELCGGTHAKNTGLIRRFKLTSESSVAAGVRRIEAITNIAADNYYKSIETQMKNLNLMLGEPKDLSMAVQKLQTERSELLKKVEKFESDNANEVKKNLIEKIQTSGSGLNVIFERVDGISAEHLKNICFQMRSEHSPLFGVFASVNEDKPMVTVFASDSSVSDYKINCGNIVRDLAKLIQGGGGGQPFFASAGGKDSSGIKQVLETAKSMAETFSK